jgi:peptide/nickel transport system permease protein
MRFLLRRLIFYVTTIWVAITANFFIPRAMPGNAVEAMIAKFPSLQPSAYAELEAAFGVGHGGSLAHQYWAYLTDLAHGNLGVDVSQYPAHVSTIMAGAIPWTIILVGTATVLAVVIGTLLGIIAAWQRGGWFDQLLPGFAFFQAVPYFFLALIILDIFALRLHWFPEVGAYAGTLLPGWHWDFVISAVYHSILPALTIVLTSMAGWMLQMRNMMITTIAEDYVLTAQAKGLSTRRVIFQYAARNAILPNLAAFALALGFIVSGALVMEVVFSYPGIGLLLFNAVTSDDFPMVQAIFLFVSIAVLSANLLADVVYIICDPRTRTRAAL